jgi:hypothetical protein
LGDCPGTPADVAEYYETDGTVQAGDAVVLVPFNEDGSVSTELRVKQAVAGEETLAIGVVSTLPNLAIGELKDAEYPKPVALVGRVPVRVSTVNGVIEPGDSLALSDIPGVLVKATSVGVVMGRAMEGFDGTVVRSVKTEELIEYMEGGKQHQRQIEETRQKLQKAIDSLEREFSANEGLILMYVSIGWQGNDLSLEEQQGQLINIDKEQLRQGLGTLGLVVNQDGILEVGEVKTQRIEIKNPYGITIYDTITGQPQCVISQSGQLRAVAGKCDGLVANVQVEDTTAPIITLIGLSLVEIEQNAVYQDTGATATDDIDGDITASIAIVNPVDTAILGVYTITYNVSDIALNAAVEITRTVNVVEVVSEQAPDTTAPVITLLGEANDELQVGEEYIDAGATATDDIDGDITSSIVTVNPVDISIEGSYTITYNVTDAALNEAVEVTRTVSIVSTPEPADTTVPVITLLGEATIEIEQNAVYQDTGATATDDIDGDITSSVVTVNPVDTTVLGSYTITYNVSDTALNVAVEITRMVNVVEPAPVEESVI